MISGLRVMLKIVGAVIDNPSDDANKLLYWDNKLVADKLQILKPENVAKELAESFGFSRF